jgi:hypothetical protein
MARGLGRRSPESVSSVGAYVLKHMSVSKLLTLSCAVIVARETSCKALCAIVVVSQSSVSQAWPAMRPRSVQRATDSRK